MPQRMLARLIPDGLALPVLHGPLKGARWLAGAAAGEGKGLSVVLGRAESAQLQMAAQLAGGVAVCFDIGANVGLYTLLFARAGARVVAFEPVPRNVAWLERTLRANRVTSATVVPWAMADRDGFDRFDSGANCAVGHLADHGRQPVAVTSVDQFVSRYGIVPDLIKIDVEGAEAQVLRGSRDTLARRHPSLLLSTHGDAARRDCLTLLRQAGYADVVPLDHRDEAQASEFCVRWAATTQRRRSSS